MLIRKTQLSDLPRLQEIFAIARRFMAETGNPTQWEEDYPSEEDLRRCMAKRWTVCHDPSYSQQWRGEGYLP